MGIPDLAISGAWTPVAILIQVFIADDVSGAIL